MKYSSLLLVVAMLLPATASAAFPDVDASHENGRAIEYLQEKGVMIGYPNGTFGPDRHLSRAELMKILVESSVGTPLPSYARQCFPDIEVDAWYASYVCYAKDQGWVSGYPDGTFRPAKDVSLVEAVKMLVNARGYETSEVPKMDADWKNAWFAPYMWTALKHWIMSGDTFWALDPGENYDDPITRKRIAEFIYRAFWNDGELSLHFDLNPQCKPADIVSVSLGGESYDYPDFIATMRDGTDCTLATDVNPLSRVGKHLVWGIMEVATNRGGQWANYVQDGKAYFRATCECDGGNLPGFFELDLNTGAFEEFLADGRYISEDYRYFVGFEGDTFGVIRVYDRKTRTEKAVVTLEWPLTLATDYSAGGGITGGFLAGDAFFEKSVFKYAVYHAGQQSQGETGTYEYFQQRSVDLNEFFGQ